MQRQFMVKSNGNVSDWLSYAGGALIKVADSIWPNGGNICQRTNIYMSKLGAHLLTQTCFSPLNMLHIY